MPKLHVFTAAYSRANYFRIEDQIRTHFVFEWSAKVRRMMTNDTITAWITLVNAAGDPKLKLPKDMQLMLEVASKAYLLSHDPHYGRQDGGPWAITTPRNVATHNELMSFLAKHRSRHDEEYWRSATDLAKALAELYERHPLKI